MNSIGWPLNPGLLGLVHYWAIDLAFKFWKLIVVNLIFRHSTILRIFGQVYGLRLKEVPSDVDNDHVMSCKHITHH